jgi:hypothetical protein
MTEIELCDINRYFDEVPVIGNEALRVAATLLFPLRKTSVIVRGESGSGKTTVLKAIIRLILGEDALADKVPDLLYIGGTSDKGLLSDDIVERVAFKVKRCVIPELQYIIGAPRNEDILKAWTEGTPYPYSRASNFGKDTQHILLYPKPVMTSFANENKRAGKNNDIGEEMERRFLPFWTESSKSMNEKVHEKKAEAEAVPRWMDKTERKSVAEIRAHFKECMELFDDELLAPEIYNPCAPYMRLGVPSRFTLSNTYIGYWHETVKGVTQFYYKTRPLYVVEGHELYLSSPADNFVAWLLVGKSVEYASLRLKDIGECVLKTVPIGEYNDSDKFGQGITNAATLDEITDAVSDEGFDRSQQQMKQIIDQLVSAGYVKTITERVTPKYYKTRNMADMLITVNMENCINSTIDKVRETFPKDVADDYVERFCTDPIAISPFTGEKINILEVSKGMAEKEKAIKKESKPKERKEINMDDFFK